MAELRIGRPQIREVFLRNGARIEPDRDVVTHMMGKTFWVWLAITLLTSFIFGLLDLIFGKSTPIDAFEAGFVAFVVLWCARQDQLRKTAPTR